jgi:hypothetical protein
MSIKLRYINGDFGEFHFCIQGTGAEYGFTDVSLFLILDGRLVALWTSLLIVYTATKRCFFGSLSGTLFFLSFFFLNTLMHCYIFIFAWKAREGIVIKAFLYLEAYVIMDANSQ